MVDAIRVIGLTDFTRACKATEDALLGGELTEGLLEIAGIVADETQDLMAGAEIDFGGRTIAGVKARIASDGSAWAQQSLRKSSRMSRRRGNFGEEQMLKGFLPAVDKTRIQAEAAADRTVQKIVDRHFS